MAHDFPDRSVTCIACGDRVPRPDAREYDKHGDRWDRAGKSFEYVCKPCFRELNKGRRDGLETIVPNEAVMRRDLEETPEVIGEAVQTILRREGRSDAYERVKDLTRGQRVDLDDFRDLFEELEIPAEVREELFALTPETYTGVAEDLALDVE